MKGIHTETYYTCMEQLMEVFEEEERTKRFEAKELSAYDEWKRDLRSILSEITGLNKMKSCDLEVKLIEHIELAEFNREKILIKVEPKVWMPVYVLLPSDMQLGEKRPCILAPHGHLGGGKYSIAGVDEIPIVKQKIEEYNYDYGVQFVRAGYIVFCPDARGFGERREWTRHSDKETDLITCTCSQLSNMALPLGRTVAGMCTWDLMKLVDYIETREECDKEQIGCVGFSGGGMQTLWLTSLDERVKCSVTSGYFYGYKDSLLQLSGNCACNYVPHLWEYVDMGDLAALIAPRPLLVQSAKADKLNGSRGLDNVLEQLSITRKAYQLFDVEHRLEHSIVEGGHKWHTQEPLKFIKENLPIIKAKRDEL